MEHVVSQNNDLNIAVIAITGGGKNLRGFMMKTPTIMNVTSRNFFEEMWPVRLNGNMGASFHSALQSAEANFEQRMVIVGLGSWMHIVDKCMV